MFMDHSFSLQFIEIVTEGLKFKRQIYLVYNLELWNLDPAMKGTDINLGGGILRISNQAPKPPNSSEVIIGAHIRWTNDEQLGWLVDEEKSSLILF